MSFDADEEILQDFLVEAGEILELLSEQLVDLEQRPDDHDLLNAIFRGFHTVKGGAGFLQLSPLVDCCHAAENVFDTLRNGLRSVDADLMDVVLQALDAVNSMFDDVRSGAIPEPADPYIIHQLHDLAQPQSAAPKAPAQPVAKQPEPLPEPVVETPQPVAAPASSGTDSDITDDEFEQLLSALDDQHDEPAAVAEPEAAAAGMGLDDDDLFDIPSAGASSDDEITEDEFEALLDQIHGKGKHGAVAVGTPASEPVAAAKPEPVAEVAEEVAQDSSLASDLITDSEFEELLDRLHGKGKFSVEAAPEVAAEPVHEDVAEAAPAVEESASYQPDPEPHFEAPVAAAGGAGARPPAAAATRAAAPAADRKQHDKEPAGEATVRVDTKRLDDIMNMVGELVLVRNRLVRLGLKSQDESMAKAVANLDVVTGDLQTSVMKTRMQPIKKVFGRFPRVVRDLARQLKKEINLELRGEETDLDKNLVEALADPLVHLVRNSVDHGVETPSEREAAGKPRVGSVVLSAEQEGDHILLQIQDDGKGMDANLLRRKVVEKGLMEQDAAERLTEQECFNLIFLPGFSTKDQISDVSGRGVGMDVVKTKISQLNGTIRIDSSPGMGTTIAIKVPLTLAIMPTLMVMLENQAFAFPLVSVNEIFHLDLTQTNIVDGQEVVVVRERPIPLFHLKRWLVPSKAHAKDRTGHVVVVSVGTKSVGFVVDQLVGQEEVVIKPLGKMLQGTAGMAGATITGDGRIALILDIPSMLNHYAARHASAA
ncbi:chemotaxis protein CheA [Oceanobacter mangrovi]|uniref:chemotaxis protein CheA n=1 Tax=Oceanobacter mangrovi TaxID=2862510 RepID=UPI001C8E1D25|nr:chemotaxis protein CheA [Oceanobacter mangrovi]